MVRSTDSGHTRASRRSAFTLVELLVVIGIIALLISILLPALSKAQRAANQTKCAAALKEIGSAFNLYSNDNQGWWPPSKYCPTAPYVIGNFTFGQSEQAAAFWFNFVGQYVDASKMGYAESNTYDQQNAQTRNVLWGCPVWQGYIANGAGSTGVSAVQIGYGMNMFPLYSGLTNYDPASSGTNSTNSTGSYTPSENFGESNVIDQTNNEIGQWFRQTEYNMSASRLLVADALYWSAETMGVASNGTAPPTGYPDNIAYQPQTGNASTWGSPPGGTGYEETLVDIFRHGTVPAYITGSQCYSPTGGKVAFNILYCDGHVGESSLASDAYLAARMHFPK